jgi:hypothetical protein
MLGRARPLIKLVFCNWSKWWMFPGAAWDNFDKLWPPCAISWSGRAAFKAADCKMKKIFFLIKTAGHQVVAIKNSSPLEGFKPSVRPVK